MRRRRRVDAPDPEEQMDPKVLNVQVHRYLKEWVRRYANQRHWSMSEVVVGYLRRLWERANLRTTAITDEEVVLEYKEKGYVLDPLITTRQAEHLMEELKHCPRLVVAGGENDET